MTTLKKLRWVPAVLAALALLAALVGLFFAVQAPPEPEWGGRKLTVWLQSRSDHGTRNALEAMGPQAFPYMLMMMRARDARWKFQLAVLLSKQKLVNFRLAPRASFRGRWEAAKGFALLGTNAAPAVPGLTRLLRDPDTASQATYALLHVGTEDAWRAVERALEDKDAAVRQAVAAQILGVDRDRSRLIPALVKALRDTSSWVREYSAQALGTAKEQPELIVPALTERLNDPSPDVSRAAADALLKFGDAATQAIPVLVDVVRKNDPTTRASALRTLRRLDTNAAAQFPAN